jgi:aminopeptidase N
MKQRQFAHFLFTAAILSLAAFSSAQVPRTNFNRAQTFDVQHYRIAISSFDRSRKQITAETTVVLKPLAEGLRTVELDAVDLAFRSIKMTGGGELPFRSANGKVTVSLDRAHGPSDTISLTFAYTASPKKGIYFVSADGARSAQIWTQGEPDEARHWFPSYDFPSDKATSEQLLTVEKGETVIANGELLGRSDNGGTETWHYKMSVPHSTYLVSFVIGRYVKVEDKYGDLSLGYYVYPGREQLARKAFGKTPEMMRIFERLTGVRYPYNKYDQTIVAKFPFGGMENITATTMADTEIFFAETGLVDWVTDLVSHELAHSWFGNLVTCRNWAELWLNEGWATYMEAVYRDETEGREAYLNKVRSDAGSFLIDNAISRTRHGLYNLRADRVAELFDNSSVTYKKGGAVLHMLREEIGRDAFWKGANIYLTRHKLGPVESTDLRRAMEEASGADLGWFFEQWVYGTGAPHLTVRPSWNNRTKTLTLAVTQTQTPDSTTPAAFRMPMKVAFTLPAGQTRQPLEVSRRSQSFTFKLAARPTEIVIDPDDKVVVKRVKISRITPAR